MEKEPMISMNETLYDDLFIGKLEERLETDPLGVSGFADLFGLTSNSSTELACWWVTDCAEGYRSCTFD